MADGVKMNQDAVTALKNLAQALPEEVENAKRAADLLRSSFEEKSDLLGPHTAQIEEILECVNDAQEGGRSSVVKVQLGLVKAAARLQAILGKDIKKPGP